MKLSLSKADEEVKSLALLNLCEGNASELTAEFLFEI